MFVLKHCLALGTVLRAWCDKAVSQNVCSLLFVIPSGFGRGFL